MRVAVQGHEWEHPCCNLEVPTHIQPPLYSFSLSIMSYLLSISSAQARFLGTEAKGTAVPIPGEFIVSWRAGYSQRKDPGMEKTVTIDAARVVGFTESWTHHIGRDLTGHRVLVGEGSGPALTCPPLCLERR